MWLFYVLIVLIAGAIWYGYVDSDPAGPTPAEDRKRRGK
jgi:hypothetical protein